MLFIEKFLKGPLVHDILVNLNNKLEAESELSELDIKDAKADSDLYRVYSYFDAMEKEPVKECIDTLAFWARRDDEKDITILLNSPGGYCNHGFALYDWILAMRRIHKFKVEIVGLGEIASMASVVIQAATNRVMHKNAWLLIHEVAVEMPDGYYDQKLSIIEDELKFAQLVERQGTKILAQRSKATIADIVKHTYKTDWWLSAKEALEWGFIDEVR